MAPKIEIISDDRLLLGEGPHWDIPSQTLYFVDVLRNLLFKYVPATGKITNAKVDAKPTIIIPVEGTKDKFLITYGRQLAVVTWDGENPVSNVEILVEVEKDKEGTSFNDGKVDPSGRLWVGTMGPFSVHEEKNKHRGGLYSLVSRNQVKQHLTGVSCSNGLAWNTKLKKFYYVDCLTYSVESFDFDIKKGEISNRKAIFKFSAYDYPKYAIPDGITIDEEGKLWVAISRGHRVIRIDPETSELLQTIMLPARKITSVTFGGPNLDTLYVVSGSFNDGYYDEDPTEASGAVFKITGLGVRGTPAVNVKL